MTSVEMEETTGERLRKIRLRHRLSQRELARKSAVANATISLIENNKLNPTVSMLKKVLDGIPIKLSEFFSDYADAPEKVFFRAEELTEIADGGVSFLQIGTNLSSKSIQMMKESYAPGSGTGKHEIVHEGEECGLVLKGQLKVTVDGQNAILKAGDAYYFESNRPHQFTNVGKTTCELISACTPPTF